MGLKRGIQKILEFVKDINISYSKDTGDIDVSVSGEEGELKFTRGVAGDKTVALTRIDKKESPDI